MLKILIYSPAASQQEWQGPEQTGLFGGRNFVAVCIFLYKQVGQADLFLCHADINIGNFFKFYNVN